MAKRVIWTNEAVTDLESLSQYISKDSEYYATAFIQEILNSGRSLDQFSNRGRVVPEYNTSSIRELIIRDYRLIYCVEIEQVTILGIIHGKRDFGKL